MDMESQRELTGIDLSNTTIADMVQELKQRCTAVMVILACEDDDGEDVVVLHRMGSKYTMLGAIEYAKMQMGTDQA